jgi:type IV pilus assembly protein PilM
MAKNQITTIDIGTNSVKVLQLELTQTGITIVNSGVGSYPRQSAADRISDEVVMDTLSQLMRDRVIKTKPVAVSVPRHFVTVKGLAGLPTSATDEDIDKMVPIQVEPELPFAIADAVYSAYNLQRSPEGVSLEVVATKRSSIERYVDIAEETGLKLKAIIPSSFATYALVFDQLKSHLAGRTVVVADIGAGVTDICVIQHGRLAFSRSFTFGGNSLTEQFESEYGLSFAMAEERKIGEATLQGSGIRRQGTGTSLTPDENSLTPGTEDTPTRQWAENLVKQIVRSLRAFAGEETIDGLADNLWLCGGSSLVSGLDDYLAGRLGIEVSVWNPVQGIEHGPQDAGILSSESISRGLSVALGLGIIGMAGEERTPTVNANLLPKEIKEREERARRKIMASVAAVLAVLILAGAGLGFSNWRRDRRALYEAVADRLKTLEQKEEMRSARAALENSILMRRMMTPYVAPLEVLRVMSEKLPDRKKIALTNLSIDKKGKVTMAVEANSHGDVSEMIQILSELELSDEVKLFDEVKHGVISRLTKEKRQIFQVQIACALNKDVIQESDQ